MALEVLLADLVLDGLPDLVHILHELVNSVVDSGRVGLHCTYVFGLTCCFLILATLSAISFNLLFHSVAIA